jgi:hypothetical protein
MIFYGLLAFTIWSAVLGGISYFKGHTAGVAGVTKAWNLDKQRRIELTSAIVLQSTAQQAKIAEDLRKEQANVKERVVYVREKVAASLGPLADAHLSFDFVRLYNYAAGGPAPAADTESRTATGTITTSPVDLTELAQACIDNAAEQQIEGKQIKAILKTVDEYNELVRKAREKAGG